MRNEQERWDNILANVKERGGRIRRRRGIAAAVTTAALALTILVSVQFGLPRERSVEPQQFTLNDVELEVVLLEHDIVLEDMDLY